MSRKLNVNQIFDPVLTVDISATDVTYLVYLLVANRPVRYGKKTYSRIVYIGTTERGIRKIASSASKQIQRVADEKLLRGLRRLQAFVIWAKTKTPPGRHRAKSNQDLWRKLERALLVQFCRMHEGYAPRLNKTGHKMRAHDVFDVFRQKRIGRIIDRYK